MKNIIDLEPRSHCSSDGYSDRNGPCIQKKFCDTSAKNIIQTRLYQRSQEKKQNYRKMYVAWTCEQASLGNACTMWAACFTYIQYLLVSVGQGRQYQFYQLHLSKIFSRSTSLFEVENRKSSELFRRMMIMLYRTVLCTLLKIRNSTTFYEASFYEYHRSISNFTATRNVYP